MRARTIFALYATHFVVDAYSSIFGPLAALIDMPAAWIGPVGFAFTIATSSTQLLFGVLADRAWGRALLIGGTFTGAVCLASAGAVAHHFATDYTLLALFLVAGGLGIAAFHPPSVVLAADLGGKNRS